MKQFCSAETVADHARPGRHGPRTRRPKMQRRTSLYVGITVTIFPTFRVMLKVKKTHTIQAGEGIHYFNTFDRATTM